ncbi:MAG: deoxyguanosinetriphosphate triphosphohydrolase [Lachnospiraceae bacterium]|nr:deoxyguanosinetriphosphate triphosphohydrolase [Lachnospiraceae bacterium]
MTIRENLEKIENELLSPYACRSAESKGRERTEDECDVRPAFQRDRDRIIHCKAFRRLKDKTQVFLTPQGDHYRTRLTHTLEVSQISRTIAKALRLNEDLTEAIALGHDLGHTPFGHAGERALNKINPDGFIHSRQSLRVVDVLEKDGKGLNLTFETRDGIVNHQTSCKPVTLEGKVVRLSDKIAYIYHDMDDALRAGILKDDRVPKPIMRVLGDTPEKRLDTLIKDVINSSLDKPDISMSKDVEKAMFDLRAWMYKHVYTNQVAKSQEGKAEALVETLYYHFLTNLDKLPEEYQKLIALGETRERAVTDYISSMTDRYAVGLYNDLFIPIPWHVL